MGHLLKKRESVEEMTLQGPSLTEPLSYFSIANPIFFPCIVMVLSTLNYVLNQFFLRKGKKKKK